MKKNAYFFIMSLLIFSNGCNFLNLLPNPQRDEWNLENVKDTSKIYLVRVGSEKERVLDVWGEPWRRKSENVWVYFFPDLVRQKIFLQFESDVVVKKWTGW